MNDIKLIFCIECGRSVSPSASFCPGCSTGNFKGKICIICNKPGKKSAIKEIEELLDSTYEIGGITYRDKYVYTYHIECLEKVKNFEELARLGKFSGRNYSCSACNKNIDIFQKNCPQCGHPCGHFFYISQEKCGHCHRPMFSEFSVSYKGKNIHKVCAELQNPNWEQDEKYYQQELKRSQDEKKQKLKREQEKLKEEIENRQLDLKIRRVIISSSYSGMILMPTIWYMSSKKSFVDFVYLIFLIWLGFTLLNKLFEYIFKDE